MTSERIDPDLTGADSPVVTYSRVAPRKVEERREPVLEASRVLPLDGPVLDRPADAGFEDAGFAEVAPDLRAERGGDAPPPFDGDVVAGLYDEGRRARPLRFVLFGAFLALAAGIGVLASSLSTVTGVDRSANEATSQPARLETAGEPPPPAPVPSETASLEPLGAAEASAEMRKIPLGAEATGQAGTESRDSTPAESAAVPVLAPPVPRPRPEPSVAVLEPPAQPQPEPETGPTVAPQPSPPVAAAPAPGTDALITRIEETLARRQSASAGAVPDAGPVVLPPPPVTVVRPEIDDAYIDYYGYPREEGYGYPADDYAEDGPWVYDEDVVPPPMAREEYYPAGPVPPAPVPYGYPVDSWQDGPGAYRGEVRGDKEPGFIKRAMNRTSDLMARVFSGHESRQAY